MDTLFTGRNIIELAECGSVNTHAIELLKSSKLTEGTVIFTKKQTSGRGQRGNTWITEEGKNLTMCFVLHPNFLKGSNSFLLCMTISLALHDLLTYLLPTEWPIKIKWPNDMLVQEKKIAGILIENLFREDQIQSSILGVGLNVNQENFLGLTNKATSLKNILNEDFELDEILKQLCIYTEKRYLQLRAGNYAKIKEEYLNNLWLFGKEHSFFTKEGLLINGWISDVNSDGKLILQTELNGEQNFNMKEIIF
jgi:BirA family biotin operon repressor/biotin-[acetyl-CoA-carboxylase] ligase